MGSRGHRFGDQRDPVGTQPGGPGRRQQDVLSGRTPLGRVRQVHLVGRPAVELTPGLLADPAEHRGDGVDHRHHPDAEQDLAVVDPALGVGLESFRRQPGLALGVPTDGQGAVVVDIDRGRHPGAAVDREHPRRTPGSGQHSDSVRRPEVDPQHFWSRRIHRSPFPPLPVGRVSCLRRAAVSPASAVCHASGAAQAIFRYLSGNGITRAGALRSGRRRPGRVISRRSTRACRRPAPAVDRRGRPTAHRPGPQVRPPRERGWRRPSRRPPSPDPRRTPRPD